jgi:hypothetical protein
MELQYFPSNGKYLKATKDGYIFGYHKKCNSFYRYRCDSYYSANNRCQVFLKVNPETGALIECVGYHNHLPAQGSVTAKMVST